MVQKASGSELPFNYIQVDCYRWNVVNEFNGFWCLEFDGSLLECPKRGASYFPEPTLATSILKLWNAVEVDSRAQYELVNVVAVNCEAHAVPIDDST